MKHMLNDGRWLMASYTDIFSFFEENIIVGKNIKDILPFELDYCIRNLGEIDDILSLSTNSLLSTDGQICLVFEDNTSLEVEFCGNGPIILGYNTAKFSDYPKYDGSCYKLKTLFKHCIGKKIINVKFEKTNNKMMFSCYRGIDMSNDDDGINNIMFILDDNSFLSAEGVVDWYDFSHKISSDEYKKVPFKELMSELDLNRFPYLCNVE